MQLWIVAVILCFLILAGFGNASNGATREEVWALLDQEPCLRLLKARRDLERAELIYYLHTFYLYQFPLRYFCESKRRNQPMALNDIILLLDQHSSYPYSPVLCKKTKDTVSIGVVLAFQNGRVTILQVRIDSAAARAGLAANDALVSIDGILVRDLCHAVRLLDGKVGEGARIVVQRGYKNNEFTAIREHKRYPSFVSKVFYSQIGYIRLEQFVPYGLSSSIRSSALKEFESKQISELIIDVRGNIGGYVAAADDLAGYFLGPVTTRLEHKPMIGFSHVSVIPPRQIDATAWLQRVPLIVLIDRHTISAAEIFAGALKHYRRAVLIGEHSYGKDTIQQNYLLFSKKTLHLTVGLWFLPDGTSVRENGVEPNIFCTKGESKIDSCLLKAIDVAQRLRQ